MNELREAMNAAQLWGEYTLTRYGVVVNFMDMRNAYLVANALLC